MPDESPLLYLRNHTVGYGSATVIVPEEGEPEFVEITVEPFKVNRFPTDDSN